MSKPRPGVAAAKRLVKSTNSETWLLVESQYPHVVAQFKGLKEIDTEYGRLGIKLRKQNDDGDSFLSKEELLTVVKWKFAVGKPRHALMKHLMSNLEMTVKEKSKDAFINARKIPEGATIKQAMDDLMELQGVGPATASAILALVKPEVFGFMYDEAIESFLPKRSYTLPTYISMNDSCNEIATYLNTDKSDEEWTPARVARILWTAARAEASNLNDFTIEDSKPSSNTKCNKEGAISQQGDKGRGGRSPATKKRRKV